MNKNIEIIDNVPIDWNKFKGKYTNKSKQVYIDFCKLLHSKGYTLESDYINTHEKVVISCSGESRLVTPKDFKYGATKRKHITYERIEPKILEFNDTINTSNIEIIDNVPIDWNKFKGKDIKQVKQGYIELCGVLYKNNHILESYYTNSRNKIRLSFGKASYEVVPKDYIYHNKNSINKISMLSVIANFKDLIETNGHILLSEYVKNSEKVLIDFNCGHEPHWITPNMYKQGHGCPLCKNKGEGALHKLLLDMGYKVETQKRYKDLKDKGLLPYDFYLPEYNLLIELDGEHHRQEVMYTNKNMSDFERDMAEVDSFLKLYDRQCKDKLKNDYAKANNIPLLRIEYKNSKIELDRWKQMILDKIIEIELQGIA